MNKGHQNADWKAYDGYVYTETDVDRTPAVRFILCIAFLLGYSFCIVYTTILSRSPSLSRSISTDLFRSWRLWKAGDSVTGKEIIENIILFVPFGYMMASFVSCFTRKKMRIAVITLLMGLMFTLCIEGLQYYGGHGSCDVDDLLNNTLGTILGILVYMCAAAILTEKYLIGRIIRYFLLPALMLLAGAAGCLQMDKLVMMTNLHTDQFWFSVDEVSGSEFSGRCRIYDRDTPSYRLYLVSGTEVTEAALAAEGESFTAKAERSDKPYEIQIKFEGYTTLPTGVYLRGDHVEYIEDGTHVPTDQDGSPILPDAVWKACCEEWDFYVYESGNELVWLIGPGIEESTEIICHVYASDVELLPENRIQYGFDNIGFFPTWTDWTLGSYRCYSRAIPEAYPVASVTVGLNVGGEIVWTTSFRP